MDNKKKAFRCKREEESIGKDKNSKKSVTGLYYGSIRDFISKKQKIKCHFEPIDDYKDYPDSSCEEKYAPVEVKIFQNHDLSSNRTFFDQADQSTGGFKPDSSSKEAGSIPIAFGVKIPLENEKNLTILAEFDVVDDNTTSGTELKQYTSHMKLSEETPSKMIFNGIIKIPPDLQEINITDIPLYIIDDKENIVANPGFGVTYKTSGKSSSNLTLDEPVDVLVKLKVDKPTCSEKTQVKRVVIDKKCLCASQKSQRSVAKSKKTTATGAEACPICKMHNSVATSVQDVDSFPPSDEVKAASLDDAKIGPETTEAATQSTVDIQASKSNQTSDLHSKSSVSSGRELATKSNQTQEDTDDDLTSTAERIETVRINPIQIKEKDSMFNADPDGRRSYGSSIYDLERRESKLQKKRREGREKLYKKRSKDSGTMLTSHNPNTLLRNTATQSSLDKLMQSKEISAQYSLLSPNYNELFSREKKNKTQVPVLTVMSQQAEQLSEIFSRSNESTATQWPKSTTSTEGNSDTSATLVSSVLIENNESKPIVSEPSEKHKTSISSGGFTMTKKRPKFQSTTFAAHTKYFESLKSDDTSRSNTVSTNSSDLIHFENEPQKMRIDSKGNLQFEIPKTMDTLTLLEQARLKLAGYVNKENTSDETSSDGAYILPNMKKETTEDGVIHYTLPRYKPKENFSTQSSNDNSKSMPREEPPLPTKDDGSLKVKYSNKAVGATPRIKKPSIFTKFINRLKPSLYPMPSRRTVAQYHTFCETSNPFKPKPIQSFYNLQNSTADDSAAARAENDDLQTIEIDKVNHRLEEEIDALQKMYNDLSFGINFIVNNQDIFPIPRQQSDDKKRSINTIKNDISDTFIELNGCLSTINEILHTASAKHPPIPSTATSKEDVTDDNGVHSQEIHSTYTTVENDIKTTIKELLKESECIKHEALLNGAQEDPEPPFFFEYFDLLDEVDPLKICKSIVEDLASKSDEIERRKLDALEITKKSVGSCSQIKNHDGNKDSKLKGDNKKTDRVTTYFCTTSISKIPKTSFSFGGSSGLLHKEDKFDKTTGGDGLITSRQEENDEVELSKVWLGIMEPNLNSNFYSTIKKSDNKEDVVKRDQDYEKNASYSNFISYLNDTRAEEELAKKLGEVWMAERQLEEIQKTENILEGGINTEVEVLQMSETILTDADDAGNVENDKEESSKGGTLLKSSKNFFDQKTVERPSTSTAYYKPNNTTEDEEVIIEVELNKSSNLNNNDREFVSDEPIPTPVSRSHYKRYHSHLEYNPTTTTSSDEQIVRHHPPKHLAKRSKNFQMVEIAQPRNLAASDSEETVLMFMEDPLCRPSEMTQDGSAVLRSTRADTSLCKDKIPQKASNRSVGSDSISTNATIKENSSESDYDADHETEQITTRLPVQVFKSKQELNSPEEIEAIEENVRQNNELARRSMRVYIESISSETLCDAYSADFNASDTSPEIYSSDNNS